MAIKNLISGGIGFSPGSVKFIPTLGFGISSAVLIVITDEDISIFALADSVDAKFNITESDHARFNLTESGDALL